MTGRSYLLEEAKYYGVAGFFSFDLYTEITRFNKICMNSSYFMVSIKSFTESCK